MINVLTPKPESCVTIWFVSLKLESRILIIPSSQPTSNWELNSIQVLNLLVVIFLLTIKVQCSQFQTDKLPSAKTKQHDFSYQFWGGFDFFKEYFKLGLELKISNGLKDINIHDGTFILNH
jgi:hypothetical protein